MTHCCPRCGRAVTDGAKLDLATGLLWHPSCWRKYEADREWLTHPEAVESFE